MNPDLHDWRGPAANDLPMHQDARFPTRLCRRRWALPASVFATLLAAAGFDRDANLARLATTPRERRESLQKNLRKFDLVLTPEQRAAVIQIDRKIQDLEPDEQAAYLAALRRFHNWLASLPDNKDDLVLAKPPGERMAEIKKLLANHPVPRVDTPPFLRIVDVGEYSPFELASIYKIWDALTPVDRKAVEQVPLGPRRLDALFKLGAAKGIDRETKPPDFDEARWLARSEAQLKNRPMFLLDEFKNKGEKADARRAEILRRQSINYFYAMANRQRDAATPERLEQFAATFPSWIQSSLDAFPPDEARRRLSAVYRLVYPLPAEIKPPAGPGAAAKQPSPGPPAKSPGPASKKPGGATPAPF